MCSLQICVDLTKFNASTRSERHVLPAVDQVVTQLSDAIKLLKNCMQLVTTVKLVDDSFIHHIHHALWFVFMDSLSPLIQLQNSSRKKCFIFTGVKVEVCMIDNVHVYVSTYKEHVERLKAVLNQLQNPDIILNKEKC